MLILGHHQNNKMNSMMTFTWCKRGICLNLLLLSLVCLIKILFAVMTLLGGLCLILSIMSHNVSSDLSDLSVQRITIYNDFSLKCSDDISNDSTNYLFSKLSVNSTGKYDGNDCVSFERPVIVSDNVSHVNDNHDIDSCIPCIPSIDCDDSVSHSLLSDYDKDNNGISFNNDDTNVIDVNHSFQCSSLKLSNNEDHVDGQRDKSTFCNNKAKMSHGSNLSVLYFNARSVKNKLDEFHARVYLENPDIIAITES